MNQQPNVMMERYLEELFSSSLDDKQDESDTASPVLEQSSGLSEQQPSTTKPCDNTPLTPEDETPLEQAHAEPMASTVPADLDEVVNEAPLDTITSTSLADIDPVPNELVSEQSLLISDQWLDNGLPAWAEEQFDIVLLDVAGLSLAVPVIALGHIHQLADGITPLAGQSDCFMDIQTTSQGKIRTVNTAKFIMPERYQEHFLKDYRCGISIKGLPWAIAANSIGKPVTVNADDVIWRSERTSRPWLAGTIKEHMCALLDLPTMGRLLQDKDVNGS